MAHADGAVTWDGGRGQRMEGGGRGGRDGPDALKSQRLSLAYSRARMLPVWPRRVASRVNVVLDHTWGQAMGGQGAGTGDGRRTAMCWLWLPE